MYELAERRRTVGPSPARLLAALLGALAALTTSGCEGPAGPAGVPGDAGGPGAPCWDLNGNGVGDIESEDLNGDLAVDLLDCTGPAGEDGEDGEDGDDWDAPVAVGSSACATCHDDLFQAHLRSGHAHAMVAVDEDDPAPPYATLGEFGHYPEEPPGGDWGDIPYAIGGWGWMQRYVDEDGFLVTGEEAQYVLQTAEFAAFEADVAPGTLGTDCATCHATGYRPDGHQDGLEGMVGTFAEPGVGCEACHGHGSHHIDDPHAVPMPIDRSAEACGQCHSHADASLLLADGAFVAARGQFNELFHSTKHSMDCIDCHDPHASARYADDDYNPNKSIKSDCAECHFQEAAFQDSIVMASFVDCIDCHMPYATKSAVAHDEWTGDVRTHLFAINTDATAEQFTEDESEAMPYLTIKFACRQCHHDGGSAVNYDDETMTEEAAGYHGG